MKITVCIGSSCPEEELSEDSSEDELSEEETDELSEEGSLSDEDEEEDELSSRFSEEDDELLSGSEETLELSAEDEFSLSAFSVSLYSSSNELFSEEISPKTASFSIISGSSDAQPNNEKIIKKARKTQIPFFIFSPLLLNFIHYRK